MPAASATAAAAAAAAAAPRRRLARLLRGLGCAGGGGHHFSSWDPSDPARFAKHAFWEDYHQESRRDHPTHEWFVDSGRALDAVLPSFEEACEHNARASSCTAVLHLGCGTSDLGVRLAVAAGSSGGLRVANVDFSAAAVEAMRRVYGADATKANIWVVADVLDMPFASASFDLVLDKGTFDAFECAALADGGGGGDRGAWAAGSPAGRLCREVDRVLKRHAAATWVQITHTAPELRMELLADVLPRDPGHTSWRDSWSVGYRSFGEDDTGFEYFVYIVRRKPRFAVRRVCLASGEETEVGRFVDRPDAEAAAAAEVRLREGAGDSAGGGGGGRGVEHRIRAL